MHTDGYCINPFKCFTLYLASTRFVSNIENKNSVVSKTLISFLQLALSLAVLYQNFSYEKKLREISKYLCYYSYGFHYSILHF